MKRFVTIVVFLIALAGVTAGYAFAVSASASDQSASQLRLLTGQVTAHGDAPLSNAIVYLKNTKTLTVKTFITDNDGNFRFPALSPNVDYELYAEYKGKKSDTKTLSSFDSRQHASINLKVDAPK